MLNEPLVLSTERIGGISAKVSLNRENLIINITTLKDNIIVKVKDTLEHLKIRCSVVCSIKELKNYLRVSPEEIQWITSDYGIVYDVKSDLNWIIVTS